MRTAIITGAYGAIGKAIARGVAAKGYHVTLAGRNEQASKTSAKNFQMKPETATSP